MTVKKYKIDNLIFFRRDIGILTARLKEIAKINKITYDNKNFCYVIEVDASEKFHNELNKLGYTTI